MRAKNRLLLTAFLCMLCCFGICPLLALAYGGGTQDEKYPQIILGEQFKEIAKQKIELELSNIGETRRHTLELVKTPPAMRCPAGDLVCEVTLPGQLRYNGINPVYVTAFVDDKPFRRVICYYRVHVFGEVLVAAHNLPLDKPLQLADVRLEEREINSRAEVYLTDTAEIMGLVPARVIKEGTPITAR